MFTILSWLIYGFIVGTLARILDWGPHPAKLTSTIIIGIIGSYIGGIINFVFWGGPAFGSSGILMGVVGAIIFCWIYRNFQLNRYIALEMQKTRELRKKWVEKIEKLSQ